MGEIPCCPTHKIGMSLSGHGERYCPMCDSTDSDTRPLCYCRACNEFVPWGDCKAVMFDTYHIKDGKICGGVKYIPHAVARLIREEAIR